MDVQFYGRTIGAWKLAGSYSGLYYAFVDGLVDCDIKPSKYPAVVIRRIKKEWGRRFIQEDKKKQVKP